MNISGHEYRFGRLSAMKQWNVLRRIAPAIIGVLGLANIKSAADDNLDVRSLIDKIEPFLEAMSKLSDDDNEYVIDTCLSVVTRQVGGDRGWVSVGTSGSLQYEDIDMLVMLRLVFETGRENLAGFFAAFRQMYPDLFGEAEPKGSSQ